MTPFDQLLQFLVANWRVDLGIIGKLSVGLLLILYLVFTLVVVRQVQLMNRTISGLLSRPLLIMAWALVAVAASVLMFSLFWL